MVFQNVPRVRRCAFWTVVFSFLAYGYRFFSAGFGGDAALVSLSGQAAYQASLGRFLQPVYWLIRGSLVVPSVVGLFTTVFLFLTCWLIANLFGLNQTRDIALLSGLLVSAACWSRMKPSSFRARPICRGWTFTPCRFSLPCWALIFSYPAAAAHGSAPFFSFCRLAYIKAICPVRQRS